MCAAIRNSITKVFITAGELEDSLKPLIFDVQEKVYKLRKDELTSLSTISFSTQEAQRRIRAAHPTLPRYGTDIIQVNPKLGHYPKLRLLVISSA